MSGIPAIPDEVVAFIRKRIQAGGYIDRWRDVLVEMINIDTTPTNDMDRLRTNEQACFDMIQRELADAVGSKDRFEQVPIDPAIADHPFYSRAFYTADGQCPNGLPADQAYAGRSNLFLTIPGSAPDKPGCKALYNAHIDVVTPHIPAKVENTVVFGRGSVDDKGLVVMMMAAVEMLNAVRKQFGLTIHQDRCYQFVIDEETGGNGALAASMDTCYQDHQAVILEATKLIPHTANRGAMWFDIFVENLPDGAIPFEAVAYVVRAMEEEGTKIIAESDHPMFLKTHVQTSFGVVGPYGKFAPAINDHMVLRVVDATDTVGPDLQDKVQQSVQAGVQAFLGRYPDRTTETDSQGNQRLEKHYDIVADDDGAVRVDIYGIGGHMAASADCDNAIVKWAYVVEHLIEQLPDVRIEPADSAGDYASRIKIEGGQGFQPTHPMADLQVRLRQAAADGLQRYARIRSVQTGKDSLTVQFDRLHNEAFACEPTIPAMQAAVDACRLAGKDIGEPVAWRASCDARIFAHGGYDTLVFGPGDLNFAHSVNEQFDLRDLAEGICILSLLTIALGNGTYQNA